MKQILTALKLSACQNIFKLCWQVQLKILYIASGLQLLPTTKVWYNVVIANTHFLLPDMHYSKVLLQCFTMTSYCIVLYWQLHLLCSEHYYLGMNSLQGVLQLHYSF